MLCVRCFNIIVPSFARAVRLLSTNTASPCIQISPTLLRSANNHRVFTYRSAGFSGKSKKRDDKVNMSFGKRLAVVSGIAASCVLFYLYLERDKELEDFKRRKEMLNAIRGKFELVDHKGSIRTEADYIGKWMLVYFGFIRCPDICPDTLSKMVHVIDALDKDPDVPRVEALFISVDPHRDTVKQIEEYLADFSPRITGFTGPPDKVDECKKSFRVFSSIGGKDENGDYIVDHTSMIYLINPDGELVEFFGGTHGDQVIVESYKEHTTMHARIQRKMKSWLPFSLI